MAVNGYIRQATANIQPNLDINAGDFNNEYNAIQTAFDNVNGHDHSGTVTGVGAKIKLATSVSGILPLANGGLGIDGTLGGPTFLGLTVNGPANITGASTLTTLATSGLATLNSASITTTLAAGATTLNSLVVTTTTSLGGNITSGATIVGAVSLQSTLNVTGLTTAAGITASGIINSTNQIQDNGSRVISINNLFAVSQTQPSNGIATAVTGDGTVLGGVMYGIGATITPSTTGRIRIDICGFMENDTNGDGVGACIRTGTGAAPTHNSALTGTVRNAAIQGFGGPANSAMPFCSSAVVTGLSLGTTYWVDLGYGAQLGGNARLVNLTAVVTEI